MPLVFGIGTLKTLRSVRFVPTMSLVAAILSLFANQRKSSMFSLNAASDQILERSITCPLNFGIGNASREKKRVNAKL